jgi:cell division inhibitor SepF
MGGALRKTMVYLGLAEEDERYEAYDLDEDVEYATDDEAPEEAFGDLRRPEPRADARVDDRRAEERRAAVTPIGRAHMTRLVASSAPVSGQVSTELHRITTIHPRTYNEAKTIGEAFRSGIPVIMNLGDMADADAKRLVDFAAGLVFGLHGAIEKVTSKVFLLSPAHVEVAPADKPHVPEPTFFNQS